MSVLSSYREDRELYIGYYEISAGIGALLAPLLGMVLYNIGGFKAPFLVLGVVYLMMIWYFKTSDFMQKSVGSKINSDDFIKDSLLNQNLIINEPESEITRDEESNSQDDQDKL